MSEFTINLTEQLKKVTNLVHDLVPDMTNRTMFLIVLILQEMFNIEKKTGTSIEDQVESMFKTLLEINAVINNEEKETSERGSK